ncbi:unnamed protein product, partial [Rotaria sp. Silwood2]
MRKPLETIPTGEIIPTQRFSTVNKKRVSIFGRRLLDYSKLQTIYPKSKRGRPSKRPVKAERLVEAVKKLTKFEIATLDTTAWSKKLPSNAPTVWSIALEENNMELCELEETKDTTVFDEDTFFLYHDNTTIDGYAEATSYTQQDFINIDQESVSCVKNNRKQENYIDNKDGKSCVHNIAEPGATSLPHEHRHLIDVLLNRPTIDGQYTATVPPKPVSLQFDKSDLDYFNKFVADSKSKTTVSSSETPNTRKRDTEWIIRFEKYVRQVNDTCVFMYKGHHCSDSPSMKISTRKQFLINADAKCNFTDCTCSFHATLYSNGEFIIQFKGRIVHSPSEQRARPVRGTHRLSITEKLTTGFSPDQLRLKELGQLTENNRIFDNYNSVGSSPHVFRKIRSEAKTSLMLDKDLAISLQKIKEEQAKEINVGKSVPGYFQTITISPLRLSLFTEGGLVLWNKVANKVPVSWDATGEIVMSKGKRLFYYELTIANIATRSIITKSLSGPSFPVTSMLSTTHTTMDLVQWLQEFEAAYRKLFGFQALFPKPPIVQSDGALAFQMAGMRFFNGDTTISIYLKRCWAIILGETDLDKDEIENCISEKNATDESESPFRDYFTKIYDDQTKTCATFMDDNFQKFMENLYYNPTYLKRILSLYLPIAPIWRNLMMGNLERYGYQFTEMIEHCGCHYSRTTGVLESRLKVIKHTVLRGEVSSRVDQVVQILGSKVRETEINYSYHYLINLTRNRSVRVQKLLAEEPWNKHAPPPSTTASRYSEPPRLSFVAQVKTALKKTSNMDKQTSAFGTMHMLYSKPHPMLSNQNLCWLNSSVQLVLANSSLVEAISKSPFFLPTTQSLNESKVTMAFDTKDDNNLLNFYSKLEISTIQYLCEILKPSSTKSVRQVTAQKYIEDLRK